ncbi:N-acetyltransferase [Candidatus Bipolaricaulota bacterium]|nr:N-acetyltransferase [Candidatus Bipolaricaulota bacterium]
MDPNTVIREETNIDAGVITEVTVAAFESLEIGDNTEQFIIMALRAAKALTVSLVAELDGRVIGHVAFSPVTLSDGTLNWYGLGPVSVLPAYHRHGVGTALVQEGLSRLKNLNASGCCVVGHPDYYRKFGFENTAGLGLEGVPPEVFLALSFDGRIPQGKVAFHDGFGADGSAEDCVS